MSTNLIISKAEIETASVKRAITECANEKAQRGAGYLTHDDLYTLAASYGDDTRKLIQAEGLDRPFAPEIIRIYARIAFHAADCALDCHANSLAER